jgi:hypothetical protein
LIEDDKMTKKVLVEYYTNAGSISLSGIIEMVLMSLGSQTIGRSIPTRRN